MAFLIDKFKGKYRLLTPYCELSKTFPRDLNGTFSNYDIYITCQNNTQIFYYGKSQLEAYIPSLGRGRNIVKAIYSDFVKPIEDSEYFTSTEKEDEKTGELKTTNSFDYDALYKDNELNKFINTIIETDEEVTFRFKWDMMEQFEKYFKPKTSAASRSPFSSKNLPKGSYIIPEEDINKYKVVASKLPKEEMLKLGRMTNDYVKTLATRKNKLEDIKEDMKKKMMKNKEYIHSIGKWDEYLKYLDKEINKLTN